MILVILGALALGYQGFVYTEREPITPGSQKQSTRVNAKDGVIPPVLGGIAVTSGLILIVSGLKRV
jgi:hypothetical protein